MSSILKALRKLEEERALRREGSIDIARDILRRSPSRPRRSAGRLVWRSALAVILLGGAGWGLSLMLAPVPRIFPPSHSAPGVTETTAGSRSPASSTLEPTGLLASVGAEAEVLTEVLREDSPARPAAEQRRAVAAAPLEKSAPPTKPTYPRIQADPPAPIPTAVAGPPSTVIAAASVPDLAVSGIVYLDDPEARLAVVNDLPVMLGTTIEGATVVEILSDRVRFRREGRFFEVGLQL